MPFLAPFHVTPILLRPDVGRTNEKCKEAHAWLTFCFQLHRRPSNRRLSDDTPTFRDTPECVLGVILIQHYGLG
jgi:hypothetical protein